MRYNFKFMQTDGVPLTADLMDQIQEAYAIYNVLGDIAGHLTILSGCEINGTLVSPGIVSVNGDVLVFEGGTIYQNVYIHQENIQKVFKNQQSKVLIEKRTVKFGDSSTMYPWADFVRLDTLRVLQDKVNKAATNLALEALEKRVEKLEIKTAPIQNGGVILPFRKPASEIPSGWKECTDTHGKMLIHCDPNDVDLSTLGASGGNKKITQTLAQMPKHSHNYTRTSPWSGSGGGFDGGGNPFSSISTATDEKGGNQPMDILNPYRIVLFIEPNFQ